ncbi:hypothetical protein TPA0907_03500 [Micromonospora humidisoli]|nr:hypothetical protein TPA0907_03500 [Micromonospora sp. AKA109]
MAPPAAPAHRPAPAAELRTHPGRRLNSPPDVTVAQVNGENRGVPGGDSVIRKGVCYSSQVAEPP